MEERVLRHERSDRRHEQSRGFLNSLQTSRSGKRLIFMEVGLAVRANNKAGSLGVLLWAIADHRERVTACVAQIRVCAEACVAGRETKVDFYLRRPRKSVSEILSLGFLKFFGRFGKNGRAGAGGRRFGSPGASHLVTQSLERPPSTPLTPLFDMVKVSCTYCGA